MSEDGYIAITGRIKDLIIRGGENIHPLEIENCLLAHSGVADVSVVGVPDERYGEVVAAFVFPQDHGSNRITTEEIQQWVRERLSNHFGEYSSCTRHCSNTDIAMQFLNMYSFWTLPTLSPRRRAERFRNSSSRSRHLSYLLAPKILQFPENDN